MEVTLAKHYGYCQGVKNAIKIVYETKCKYPNNKIFLLNKLVHNSEVIEELKKLGINVLDDNRSLKDKLKSIPDYSVIIYSAHGHDESLESISKEKNLIEVDAICPRVKLNMNSIKDYISKGENIIYIGIDNHPETVAALSIDKNIHFIDFKNPNYANLDKLKSVIVHNQTTLIQSSLEKIYEELKKHINDLKIKNDICFATQDRQNSLSDITDEDLILVIGDKISSNSTRLFELSKSKYPNKDVYQVSTLLDLIKIDLSKYKKAFITAGASTPDSSINPIIEYLKQK